MKRRPLTWGDIYWKYRRKGCDASDAAFRADEWERHRKQKRRAKAQS